MNTKPEMLLFKTNISILSLVYNMKYEAIFVIEMLPPKLLSNNLFTTFWVSKFVFLQLLEQVNGMQNPNFKTFNTTHCKF